MTTLWPNSGRIHCETGTFATLSRRKAAGGTNRHRSDWALQKGSANVSRRWNLIEHLKRMTTRYREEPKLTEQEKAVLSLVEFRARTALAEIAKQCRYKEDTVRHILTKL